MEELKKFQEWMKKNPNGTVDDYLKERRFQEICDALEIFGAFINSKDEEVHFSILDDEYSLFRGEVRLHKSISLDDFLEEDE